MNANDRIKIIKTINDAIKQYEATPHETNDTTYYDTLYKLHQAEMAISSELDKYLGYPQK